MATVTLRVSTAFQPNWAHIIAILLGLRGVVFRNMHCENSVAEHTLAWVQGVAALQATYPGGLPAIDVDSRKKHENQTSSILNFQARLRRVSGSLSMLL